MNTEYEARVLEIDREKIVQKIKDLGGKLVGEWEQKRYVYDFTPAEESKWIRLRTNGEVATLTVKEIVNDKIDGTREWEVEVSDFEGTNAILNQLGYKARAYQENRRTRYMLDGVELDIDEWPRIPAYLEIEAASETEVMRVVELLGVEPEKVTTLGVSGIYSDFYGIDVNAIPELRF